MKNDPLLLEIQEEINRENMMRFVNKYGKMIAVFGFVLLVLVAAYQGYKQYRENESAAAGTKIYGVMRDMDKPQDEFAVKSLDETAKQSGYKEISLLNKAQIQVKNNKVPEAVETLDALAKNTSADKSLRDLAGLNAANLLLNTNAKADGLEKRLVDLTATDNTFHYNAMELLAVYYLQNNNQKKADDVLQKLVSEANVPVTIAKRASELSPDVKGPEQAATNQNEE